MRNTDCRRAFLVLLLACSVDAGCARPSSPAGPDAAAQPQARSAMDGAQQADITCRLIVGSSTVNLHSVDLSISNHRSTPLALRYSHPLFVALEASIGDKSIPLHQAPSDMPVVRRTLHVEPGQTATLMTPVKLRFGAGPEQSRDAVPFDIWIQHAPARVHLRAERVFENEPSLTCEGPLEP